MKYSKIIFGALVFIGGFFPSFVHASETVINTLTYTGYENSTLISNTGFTWFLGQPFQSFNGSLTGLKIGGLCTYSPTSQVSGNLVVKIYNSNSVELAHSQVLAFRDVLSYCGGNPLSTSSEFFNTVDLVLGDNLFLTGNADLNIKSSDGPLFFEVNLGNPTTGNYIYIFHPRDLNDISDFSLLPYTYVDTHRVYKNSLTVNDSIRYSVTYHQCSFDDLSYCLNESSCNGVYGVWNNGLCEASDPTHNPSNAGFQILNAPYVTHSVTYWDADFICYHTGSVVYHESVAHDWLPVVDADFVPLACTQEMVDAQTVFHAHIGYTFNPLSFDFFMLDTSPQYSYELDHVGVMYVSVNLSENDVLMGGLKDAWNWLLDAIKSVPIYGDALQVGGIVYNDFFLRLFDNGYTHIFSVSLPVWGTIATKTIDTDTMFIPFKETLDRVPGITAFRVLLTSLISFLLVWNLFNRLPKYL